MSDASLSPKEQERYFAHAANYILRRARSRREMLEYMTRREWPESAQQMVLQRLEESGLVDDLEFGRRWVADRQALRPRSRRELVQELRGKGLEKSTIAQVLDDRPDTAEFEALQLLVAKKRRTSHMDDKQLQNWLVRKGFDWRLVQKIVQADDLIET